MTKDEPSSQGAIFALVRTGLFLTDFCVERRFTGSAGVAVVTLSASAHLFTDSRYWSQAEKEIDENWILEKVGSSEVKNWDKWLLEVSIAIFLYVMWTLC